MEAINEAERLLLSAFAEGQTIDLSERRSGERRVRADFLSSLLLDSSLATTRARMRLKGARIVGTLDLEERELSAPILICESDFEEAPNFSNCRLSSLKLPGCKVPGLVADGLESKTDVMLSSDFTSTGQVSLKGARIGGLLSLSGGRFGSEGVERAIVLSRASIGSHLLGINTVVGGQLRAISAQVGGVFSLRQARLKVQNGKIALQAERIIVSESIFLHDADVAGQIFMQNATIQGGVNCARLKVRTMSEKASIQMFRTTIGRSLSFEHSELDGVWLVGLKADDLSFVDCGFVSNPQSPGLNLESADLGRLRLFFAKPPSKMNLRFARVALLKDDISNTSDSIRLEGFSFDNLEGASGSNVSERIAWVRRDPDGYRPDTYEQLVKFYQLSGEERSANQVAIAKQRARRKTLGLPGKVSGYFLDITIGYGQRKSLAVLWFAAFLIAGSILFTVYPGVPVDPGKPSPGFNAIMYSLDVLLPIIDLGQEKSWLPVPGLQWAYWVLVLIGWALTTAIVAAFTKLLGK